MEYIKTHRVRLTITFLSLIPVFLWASMYPLPSRFSNLSLTFTSLGQIAGLMGLIHFSINFILAGRFAFLENFFGGVNKMYVYHQKTGKYAFYLLLLHPLFLSGSYALLSIKSALIFLLPSTLWAKTFGQVALLVLTILIVITLYYRNSLKYETWKMTHKFLGFSLFFASLHIFLIPSDISVNPYLRFYVLTFAFLAIVSYTYRVLLGDKLIKRYLYEVVDIKKIANDVVEISFNAVGDSFAYKPGQFVFIRFLDKILTSQIHPFSISSAPDEKYLKITVKQLGDYTKNLDNLTKGMKAQIEGPFGKFTFSNYENKNQVWIAGGIGITPFVGMVRELKRDGYIVDLFYAVKFPEEAAYLDELKNVSKTHKRFRLFSRFTEKEGRLDVNFIAKTIGKIASKDILICGPTAMMQAMRRDFMKVGVPHTQIHTEEFALS